MFDTVAKYTFDTDSYGTYVDVAVARAGPGLSLDLS
jgi:hypothetical protein